MINKQLLASLLRSQDENTVKLAIFLCNWDFHLMKDVLFSDVYNPQDNRYTAFGLSNMFFTIASGGNIIADMIVPQSKRIKERFVSWEVLK